MLQSGLNVDPEWERRKIYLLQCLYGYREDLTPIPERDEVVSPEKIPSEESSVTSSSLPSLIIELEPQRNKLDDPDDFYEELERSAKKFYKHKMLQNRSYSSFDELESKFGDDSLSSPSLHEESPSRPGKGIRSSIDHENIIAEEEFRAEISRITKADRFEGEIEDKICDSSFSSACINEELPSRPGKGIRSLTDQENIIAEEEFQAEISHSTNADRFESETQDNIFLTNIVETSGTSLAREVEVMRAQRKLTLGPQFSPERVIIDEPIPRISPKEHNISRQRATTSGSSPVAEEIQQASLIDIPINTSPRTAKRKTEDEENEPRSKEKKRDKWEEIFQNFFVGRPRMFNIVECFPDSSRE